MSPKLSLNDACVIAEFRGTVKLTLENIKQIALSKHGECLSTEYKNNQLPLMWRCKENHLWRASVGNVKSGKWCPYCAGNAQLTLEDAKQIALNRNGKCLSTIYKNSDMPMAWKCHQGNIKLTLEDAKKIALSRYGECLSTEYKNINDPLIWKCQFNHQWRNDLNHVKNRGQWCPFCIGRNQSIKDMCKLAQTKNGDCLSDQYYDSQTKLE
ncbi:17174_t:CDS:2 [Racocetra persica]|uniref:17174_t:CDS:1 n=1 Tax=Racocetra persica TaxID=160502 RepID=A0ACA9S2C7_9GLOM|nr:17174_t:CDS:2 [Racocetra persica]